MQKQQHVFGVASRAAACAGLLAFTGVAHAQWTVTYLHPPGLHPEGATQSYATGGSGTTQVGYTVRDNVRRACRWSGSASSWVDVNPAGSVSSAATAASGTQIGGWAWGTNAALWSGASVAGLNGSTISGMSGTHQVGYYVVSSAGYIFHALLWNGTAASRVDLNPPFAVSSFAYGVSGTQQVGDARDWEQGDSAVLWNGTAASCVILNPAGASGSCAFATSGTQQVGSAYIGPNAALHAGLWSGSAASWVDLHPAGATSSEAYSISGTYQAGYANLGVTYSSQAASLWSGTPASWENLSLALTGSWSNTVAQCVWSDGATLYVAGSGHNNTANRDEALLWSRPLPASCYPNCDNSAAPPILNVVDFSCFLNRFAAGEPYANCDNSTASPVLNVLDFACFLSRFAAGCP
jgi:hypothetical protein